MAVIRNDVSGSRVMRAALTYAAISPARNERENLRRLFKSLCSQSTLPSEWIIVDDGSTDGTRTLAEELTKLRPWIRVISSPGPALRAGALSEGRASGRDIIAFQAGLDALGSHPDVVVKLDADVSLDTDHFQRLLARFHGDASLGLASGTCFEYSRGVWSPVFVARNHVRGAVRAYRWACLQDVLPLEERLGWDGVDEIKAAIHGWKATSFSDLPFYHHRAVGGRDGRRREWHAQGEVAHYLGYRPSYVVLKTAFRALREPQAIALLSGYLEAVVRRRPQYTDQAVRAYLRRQQRLRALPLRLREVLGSRLPRV